MQHFGSALALGHQVLCLEQAFALLFVKDTVDVLWLRLWLSPVLWVIIIGQVVQIGLTLCRLVLVLVPVPLLLGWCARDIIWSLFTLGVHFVCVLLCLLLDLVVCFFCLLLDLVLGLTGLVNDVFGNVLCLF